MRLFTKLGLGTCAILLVSTLLVGPHLIDREALRLTLVEQFSTALGHPVRIGRLDVRFLPQPAITLERITAGLSDEPDGTLNIGRIHAAFSPWALLDRQIRFTRVDIDTLALNPELLARLQITAAAMTTGTTGSHLDVRLQQARIAGLTWTTADGLQLGPFTTTLDWQNGKRLDRIVIAQDDGQLQALMRFADAGIDIQVQANEWSTPVLAPLHKPMQITQLQSQLRYADGHLHIVSAELAGPVGKLRLHGQLDWQNDWHFAGRLAGERVDLPLLLSSFGQQSVPGQSDGECALQLNAPSAAQLFQQPGLDCDLRHTHSGKAAQLKLTTTNESDALAYTLQAKNLTLPMGPKLHFDTLDLHGKLASGQLSFAAAKATGYQGELDMQGVLTWHAGWQWNFTAHSQKLRLDPLLAVFGQHNLDGSLAADCQGALADNTFSGLFQQPGLNCDFVITEGVLHNADLEQAIRLLKTGSKTAGSTPFDHLSGRMQMQRGQTHFTGLKLHSLVLEAKGDVSIRHDKQLSGELTAGLKNTGGIVSVPLVVSGSVGDPVIRPTNSALAGGAAGTMLLGPGVGTAVGVKVGEAFSKLTGWLKPKPKTAATNTSAAE